MTQSEAEFSQRAQEVAEDLFAAIATDCGSSSPDRVQYRLDGSDITLTYQQAVRWVKESVDAGFPSVRHVIEGRSPVVVVNLAAFEDPDSQFHE